MFGGSKPDNTEERDSLQEERLQLRESKQDLDVRDERLDLREERISLKERELEADYKTKRDKLESDYQKATQKIQVKLDEEHFSEVRDLKQTIAQREADITALKGKIEVKDEFILMLRGQVERLQKELKEKGMHINLERLGAFLKRDHDGLEAMFKGLGDLAERAAREE